MTFQLNIQQQVAAQSHLNSCCHMPGVCCYQSGAEASPWRLTNRKEATVSQSVRMRQAAFESTNEDPAESEAEGGREGRRQRKPRLTERGRKGEGEENTKPDADRGRTGGRPTTGYNATPGLAGVPSFPSLSCWFTALLFHIISSKVNLGTSPSFRRVS